MGCFRTFSSIIFLALSACNDSAGSGADVEVSNSISATAVMKAGTPQALITLASPTATVNPQTSSTPPAVTAGTTYYLAPASLGGSDLNNGLSASRPWLSPNHALNCGDVILAAASSDYASANFNTGKWGPISCASPNRVAWLKCSSFDACKISASAGTPGIHVDQSFWGVQGFEVDATSDGATACFEVSPNSKSAQPIHHIILANIIANGCRAGGIAVANSGPKSVDYIALVGNIVYDAVQASDHCYNGISIFQPAMLDVNPGTHLYIAGNFSYGNLNPSTCGNHAPDGGDGIELDAFDGVAGNFPPFQGQTLVENNLVIGNGARGIEVQNNRATSGSAKIILRNNTIAGNNLLTGSFRDGEVPCSEVSINSGFNVHAQSNLISANSQKACNNNPLFGVNVFETDSSSDFGNNFIAAQNLQYSSAFESNSFAFGANTQAPSAAFLNPSIPSAPHCNGTASTAACMLLNIASYASAAPGTQGLGFQSPSAFYTAQADYPKWLCGTELPSGLISNHCEK